MSPAAKAEAIALFVAIDAMTPRQHFADEQRHAANESPDPLAGIVKPQQWHQAQVGRRRSFLSAGDARAYEAGYRAYPHDDGFAINTPFSAGWFDAEKRETVAV